jgi:hypothetical protein
MEVPETPKTKVRLTAASARPTFPPLTTVAEFKSGSRLQQISAMSAVAALNLKKKNCTGGMVFNPTLLATKLPPQRRVVRTRM